MSMEYSAWFNIYHINWEAVNGLLQYRKIQIQVFLYPQRTSTPFYFSTYNACGESDYEEQAEFENWVLSTIT